jgi:Putative zinc ribbon domain
MESQNKFCQSCGMPLKKDPQHGGTFSDGTKSELYCSYCFQKGTFTFNGTVDEMQEYCKGKMIEQGSPKWIAWMFTRGMRRLERWRR